MVERRRNRRRRALVSQHTGGFPFSSDRLAACPFARPYRFRRRRPSGSLVSRLVVAAGPRPIIGTHTTPPAGCRRHLMAIFLFLYISTWFFTKIYFCFRNLQKYTPAAGWQGLFCKKICEKFTAGPWRTGRPAAGRPAPGRPPAGLLDMAAQLRGDHLPSKKAAPSFGLPPSFGSKIPEKKTRFVVTLFIHHIMV